MNSLCLKIFKRFFLFTVFIFAVTGCGSSSSTANNGTGSIAAKLVWSSPEAKTTAKTLYSAPAGVEWMQIIVSAADMQDTVSDSFPAADGTGTVSGIPAGSGRTVTVNGLDGGGIILYQGIKTGVTIVAGEATPVIITLDPITNATPPGGSYSTLQIVTLTASEPATIYYTTNGDTPTTSSTSGRSPISGITVAVNSVLKFFAIFDSGIHEAVKTESYHNP